MLALSLSVMSTLFNLIVKYQRLIARKERLLTLP